MGDGWSAGTGLGPDVLDAEPLAGFGEGEGFIAAAVIGHDTLDGDAEASVVGDGCAQEGDGACLAFVWKDGRGCDPGVVVDGDVGDSQPGPWPLPRALLWPRRSPVMRWPTTYRSPISGRKRALGVKAAAGRIVAEYVEPGASATNDRRPEFQKMVAKRGAGTGR